MVYRNLKQKEEEFQGVIQEEYTQGMKKQRNC